MKIRKTQEYVLGFAASATDVDAVLLHNGPDGPELIRTFHRSRTSGHFSNADLEAPGLGEESGADFSFTLSEGETVDNSLFLSSEFSVDGDDEPADLGGADFTVPSNGATPFDLEALEIMAECEAAGYDSVRVVFALGSEHTQVVPIKIPSEAEQSDGKTRRKAKSKSDEPTNELLFELLDKTHKNKYTEDKTVFLPLVSSPGSVSTRLAVFPQPFEPVTPTLRAIRDRKRSFPSVLLVDTEINLLSGLVRAREAATDDPSTRLIVRVGSDDTMVIFMLGDDLLHVENLRSVTVFDPAETVCSRVLLLQDELGRGDVECVWLFSDERESALEDSFRQFFQDTEIKLIRSLLPPMRQSGTEPISGESLLAATAALRTSSDAGFSEAFGKVNFLDSKLAGKQSQIPFSWPVAAMIVILFASTLFFVGKWFEQQSAIVTYRSQLQTYPRSVINADLDQLEYRIDSLQARSAGLTESLDVLDSLLVGSDTWSRAMERVTGVADEVTGIWIEDWSADRDAEILKLSGKSVTRAAVVALASELDAILEHVRFSDVREWPVYTWEMTMQMDSDLPEAARLLREQVRDERNRERQEEEKSTEPLISGLSSVDTIDKGS